MKLHGKRLWAGLSLLVLLVGLVPQTVFADSAPGLVFREAKITGDEFVVLQANQPVADLGSYWLGYTGSDTDPAPPVQQLPAVPLAAGQSILLSKGGNVEVCGESYLASLAPSSLSDTKGTLALWHMDGDSFSELAGPQTRIVWAKSTKAAPVDMARHSLDLYAESSPVAFTSPAWYYDGTAWRVANIDAGCTLSVPTGGGTPGTTVVMWPTDNIDPPAVIESLADDSSTTGPYLPTGDIGLTPPQITELLPNPMGTGTDATDEFIELYNPNGKPFDLGGFTLETGLSTKHKYVFPAGASLAPKVFTAFYSADTGLTLSNTSGQADLLDPFGTQIAATDPYGSAKDGQAWALAKGEWYFTNKPTPNAVNIINQTIATTSAKKAASAVKGASTAAKSALQGGAVSAATSTGAADKTAPLHPYLLAAVAVAAVGYCLYEYRHDLGNKLHQFRTNRAARRKIGA